MHWFSIEEMQAVTKNLQDAARLVEDAGYDQRARSAFLHLYDSYQDQNLWLKVRAQAASVAWLVGILQCCCLVSIIVVVFAWSFTWLDAATSIVVSSIYAVVFLALAYRNHKVMTAIKRYDAVYQEAQHLYIKARAIDYKHQQQPQQQEQQASTMPQ